MSAFFKQTSYSNDHYRNAKPQHWLVVSDTWSLLYLAFLWACTSAPLGWFYLRLNTHLDRNRPRGSYRNKTPQELHATESRSCQILLTRRNYIIFSKTWPQPKLILWLFTAGLTDFHTSSILKPGFSFRHFFIIPSLSIKLLNGSQYTVRGLGAPQNSPQQANQKRVKHTEKVKPEYDCGFKEEISLHPKQRRGMKPSIIAFGDIYFSDGLSHVLASPLRFRPNNKGRKLLKRQNVKWSSWGRESAIGSSVED